MVFLLACINYIVSGEESGNKIVVAGTSNEVEYISKHFGEQKFIPQGGFLLKQGQILPKLVWVRLDLVKQVVKDCHIPYRWFNEELKEVKVADKPGLYYVYGEAPTPQGPPLRRAMTCLCLKEDIDLMSLAQSENQKSMHEQREIIQKWTQSEEGVLCLYGKLRSNAPATQLNIDRWNMHNATNHVKIKRIVLGIHKTPPVVIRPVKINGTPAPVLHQPSKEMNQKYSDLKLIFL